MGGVEEAAVSAGDDEQAGTLAAGHPVAVKEFAPGSGVDRGGDSGDEGFEHRRGQFAVMEATQGGDETGEEGDLTFRAGHEHFDLRCDLGPGLGCVSACRQRVLAVADSEAHSGVQSPDEGGFVDFLLCLQDLVDAGFRVDLLGDFPHRPVHGVCAACQSQGG